MQLPAKDWGSKLVHLSADSTLCIATGNSSSITSDPCVACDMIPGSIFPSVVVVDWFCFGLMEVAMVVVAADGDGVAR